ncbi:MAG: hypothetical protein H6817_11605 [Phycisphaerales bacterium]|nr:hypothetical protein [Phycisphaerales bacterium]
MMTLMIKWMLAAAVVSAGFGDEDRILIEQSLDRPVTLSIKDEPLADAFRTIAEKSGVGVSIGPDTMALLPYGEATRVSLSSQNDRLRDGLTALCNTIGMEYFVTDSGIEIVPSPALYRLGRPISWEELSTLSKLMSTHWTGDDDDEYKDIRDQIRFDGVNGELNDNRKQLGKLVEDSGAGSAAAVLDRACAAMNCTWIPWADEIVVMSSARQVEYQMQRVVSLQYQYAPLAEVLRGLSRQAGVPIRMDAAAAASLPDRVRDSLSLVAEGVTVQEALEQIVIATGLAYKTDKSEIVLYRPPTAEPTSNNNRQRDPIVGKVIVQSPDGKHTYEWFIRESDLTAEERARLEKLKREGAAALRHDLAE